MLMELILHMQAATVAAADVGSGAAAAAAVGDGSGVAAEAAVGPAALAHFLLS